MTSLPNRTQFFPGAAMRVGHVIWDVSLLVLCFHQKIRPRTGIVLSKLDVQSVFCQIPVDCFRVPVFGYVVDDFPVVDLR